MSLGTTNHKLFKYEDNDNADLRFLQNSMDTIDRGLVLDVGSSTGIGNNYILNLGSITLTSANKGISFRFFADKNSTGAVTINGTYNLLDSNLKAVKNIKTGVPYTTIYDGGSNFFLASGGSIIDYASTSVGIDGNNVLAPQTYIGTDGELHTGTMPNRGDFYQALSLNGNINLPSGYYNSVKVTQNITTRGDITDAVSQYTDSSGLYTRIPIGAYFTKASSGYPEIKSKLADVTNALNTLPSANKTEVVSSLGGKIFYLGTKTHTFLVGDINECTVSLGFKPTTVIMNPHTDNWIFSRSTDVTWFTGGWDDSHPSSSSSYSPYKRITSFTDDGFTYRNGDTAKTYTTETTLTMDILAIG